MTSLRDPMPIAPVRTPFDLAITPPGSKSITCRAYVLAALAQGTSRIVRPLRAKDTDALLAALCTLGARASWTGDDVSIATPLQGVKETLVPLHPQGLRNRSSCLPYVLGRNAHQLH